MKSVGWRLLSMLVAFAVVVTSAQIATAQSIARIEVRLKTGDADGAGTDCRVYLGLGGREFNLDIRDTDDRRRNSNDLYALGEVGNVFISGDNDPRAPLALTVENAYNYPVYIRMSDRCSFPAGGWNLDYAEVRVNPGPEQIVYNRLGAINDGVYLWLAAETGLTVHLNRGSQLVDPAPQGPLCPLGRKCCEPQADGCRLCIPEAASCP